ncbi:MAG TPA: histidine kinase N-terminal domain-containing protein [Ilumatobacteraceae bacterium]|nr:histidine kinase N-terminal domain-containing protein [Ilumatobacteraceae bacterium]
MTSLAELVREHTTLHRDDTDHLHRLTAEWAFLADLCFADLLLYVRAADGKWLIIDQVRPATNQTMYVTDYVGSWADGDEAELIERAATTGQRVEGSIELDGGADEINHGRMLAIPVRRHGEIIAVLTKEWKVRAGRPLGELERNYSFIFEEFAQMIEVGTFPFAGRVADSSAAPRVGDGVLTLDASGTVTYVSPNANSALHRVGIQANPVGMRLAELGFHDGPVRQAFERGEPIVEEFEQGADVTLLCRCVPLVATTESGTEIAGGLLLVRDVTELRKRDRLLLSKDATIREIHHRVKNNLQTISSLLRLQSRRLTNPEARAAVQESVRRIRTIALVHESLSREPGEDIAFIEIVRPLLRLAEESLQSPDRPVRFTVSGDGGRIPANTATPLSVVLTELLQNAVDHGFPEGSGGGDVNVRLSNLDQRLTIRVVDNGRGVDPSFELEQATGLGLSIVRTLVTTELNGTIDIRPATADELDKAGLDAGSERQHGTVIELVVPTDD